MWSRRFEWQRWPQLGQAPVASHNPSQPTPRQTTLQQTAIASSLAFFLGDTSTNQETTYHLLHASHFSPLSSINTRTFPNTPSSISGVRRPVCVFWRLGW
jgi:hypothetical protein